MGDNPEEPHLVSFGAHVSVKRHLLLLEFIFQGPYHLWEFWGSRVDAVICRGPSTGGVSWPLLKGTIWRRHWHPTPVLLPGKSHGRRSLEGCSPWGRWVSDTTERLHFHFSLSCIGEGNGNPLQCSCLENPRDGVAWWAAIYGVAQSRTRLKRLSSSKLHL